LLLFYAICFHRKKGDNSQAVGEYAAELTCLKVT
jgi:hypothetical protein